MIAPEKETSGRIFVLTYNFFLHSFYSPGSKPVVSICRSYGTFLICITSSYSPGSKPVVSICRSYGTFFVLLHTFLFAGFKTRR